MTDIDNLDNNIIKLLLENSHYTSFELSEKLDTSASTIRRRIKRLIDKEIIRQVTLPDHEKLGRPILAIITFEISPNNKIRTVSDKLGTFENCTWVAVVSGRFSIISLWRFSSTEALYLFLENDAGNMEGVVRTESFIALHLGKHP